MKSILEVILRASIEFIWFTIWKNSGALSWTRNEHASSKETGNLCSSETLFNFRKRICCTE